MGKTVLIALSGGVDSTYALLRLVEQGYNVTGVTFKINNNKNTIESIEEAAKIAKLFNVEHIVVDYEEIFNKEVIQTFVSTYKSGKTPNPCVVCNKTIKFGELNNLRKKLNIDYIATGHYVNIEKSNDKYYIKKAVCSKKDQSYFLNQVSADILQYCIFPLGNVESKEYVRKVLADNNIEISTKKDSQEICFIQDDDYVNFLKEYIPENEGIIRSVNNKIIGKHKGTSFYTIGQRRGLGVSSSKPLFIKKIDAKNNEIILAEEQHLFTHDVTIENVNILAPEFLDKKLTGKIRYRSIESEVDEIVVTNDLLTVKFANKQRSVTAGQYLVVYYNEYLVLGGEIT